MTAIRRLTRKEFAIDGFGQRDGFSFPLLDQFSVGFYCVIQVDGLKIIN